MEMSIVEIPKGRYYGTESAAKELGVTVGRIRQMVRWGELSAIRVSDRSWLIAEAEIRKAKRVRKID